MRPEGLDRKPRDTVEIEAAPSPAPEEDWRPKPPPPAPPPPRKNPLAPFLRVAPYALFVAVAFFVVAALQGGLFGDALATLQEGHRSAVERVAGASGGPSAPLPTYGEDPAGAVAVGAPRTDARGALTLVTDSPVTVFIDGSDRGLSPLTALDLEAGEHLVRLVNPKQKSRSREFVIEVQEGATLRLEEKAP